ncbi:MAG: chorismate-binding protein [Sphingomonadaceae bacterium]|uniref:anthranilate synthase component I family protein n=1 Tax=Sphingorhabdus sp. TaxID=1902408 RepID=UPI0039BD0DA6|nr:chorismate-binding protein [Sphingomonadaceae bacterium]
MATKPELIWRKRIADTETPVSAALKLFVPERGDFILESVEGGEARGRHSLIGIAPDLVFRAAGDRAEINSQWMTDRTAFAPSPLSSLDALRALAADCRMDVPEELPPALACLVGYFGYETIGLVEKLPRAPQSALELPDMLFVRPTVILVFGAVPVSEEREIKLTPVLPEGRYAQMVASAKDYIEAGDIFQVVLAQRFTAPFDLPPVHLYRALRRINPSPFLYFIDLPGFALIGSSPEILVRARGGEVTIRPIAGTRPRGKSSIEDAENRASLLADPKERAEHLMLLDLGRNDVGRVTKGGSVTVTDSYMVEFYSHVMHIVSNVVGELADDKDAIDALFAGFPAGTVSGAPKVRACEIIAELEPETRGAYAGGVGYFSPNGDMDSCIVLRTGIVKDGVLHVQAGAGIVADSNPEYEQRECEAKAGALIAAAREAFRVAGEAKFGQ